MTSMFTDHSGLDDMVSVAKLNSFRSTGTRFGIVQSFWASTARAADDNIADVLEITLTDSYLINALQFDLAKFPHTMRAQYWRDDVALWVPFVEVDGSQCVRYINQCVPLVIPPSGSVTGHQHPQHSFVGHWQTELIVLAPIQVQRIRITLIRAPSITVPTDVFGSEVDYSLAVRNFSLGFTVSALNDVPRTLPSADPDGSYFEPFGSGDDVVGSGIDFTLRKLEANRAIIDNASDQIWRCEPQPDPSCVVNMYADVRTPQGDPVVVDRILMDPTNNGAHVTAYYATQTPTGDFLSPDQPVATDTPDSGSSVYVDARGLHMDVGSTSETYDPTQEGDTHYFLQSRPLNVVVSLSSDGTVYVEGTDYEIVDDGQGVFHLTRDPSGSIPADQIINIVYQTQQSVILDNTGFNYNTPLPWWVGLTVMPLFNSTDLSDTEISVLFDCGAWVLVFSSEGLVFTTSGGDTIYMPLEYQRSVVTSIIISYDGDDIGLWAVNQLDSNSSQTPVAPMATVTKIAINSTIDRSQFGKFQVSNLVIKEEVLVGNGTDYVTDPRAFTRVEPFSDNEPDTSRLNAILRFDPLTSLQSSAYPWCIFGGTPNKFESMTWTPISREYTTQRGWMELPPVLASYWKLEFTNLPPAYSDIAIPVSQQIRRFPAEQIASYRSRLEAVDPPPTVGDTAHAQVVSFTSYLDTPVVVSTGGTGQGFSNTEVFVADDLGAADRLYDQKPSAWSYQQHLTSTSAPRFTQTQVHVYDTSLISRTSKIAYQIGLRSLKFARTTFSSQYDTPQYVDMLYDIGALDPKTNWVFDNDRLALTSGNSTSAKIVSKVYESNRDVRAVQFAAQQSPPVQLLDDPDFTDTDVINWTAFGDARLGDIEETIAFGNLLPVIRTVPVGRWGDIAARYVTWGGVEAAGTTWGDLTKPPSTVTDDITMNALSNNGGVVSEAVPLPIGGYLYAAARVSVRGNLTSPLWLQLVDSVTGAVLAEDSVVAAKGQVAEWYTTYAIGSALAQGGVTWGDLSGDTHYPTYLDQFIRANSVTLGRLDSGQGWDSAELWNGSPGSSLQIVSNQAVVTATGQRSTIDVGTPWGKLVVQLGNLVTGTAELIDMGGIVLLANGKLTDSETGHVFMTLALASNDTLQFESMPTSQVVSGKSNGSDASVFSWSIVVTRNNTFVATASFTRPISSVRGISGDVGQTFKYLVSTPIVTTIPLDTIIEQNPIPRDGVLSSDGGTWTQASDARPWIINGAYTLVDNGIQQTLTAQAGTSFDMSTDVDSLHGSMTVRIALSTTTTDATTYYVLRLDDGSDGSLYLRADGALIQSTQALGTVVLKNNATSFTGDATTVMFADTSKLSAAFISAQGLLTSLPQTLIFFSGQNVTGTYQGTSLWSTSMRGVMATDGSSVTGFTWAPNLGGTNTGTGHRTWGDLSANGTRTWAEVARTTDLLTNPVVARVMQKSPSSDIWYMDSSPIFWDPIVWEFSNDGGTTYTQASTVRNNPKGVVLLDTSAFNANQLSYRVTSYAKEAWLSHLVIRPWYQGHMRDVPVRPPVPHGPNLNPLDGYCSIDEDPNFQVWSIPVPREWWYAFRSILPGVGLPEISNPVATERFVL